MKEEGFQKMAEMLLGKSNLPCFLADVDTNEVIYLNYSMKKLLGDPEDALGEKFYNLIDNRGTVCDVPHLKKELAENAVIERYIYNEGLEKHLKVCHTLLHIQGNEYHLTQYQSLEEPNLFGAITFDETMTQCISIFQKPKEEVNISFMKLLTHFYDCDRAYIFRIDVKNEKISKECQWCRDQFEVTPELSSKMDSSLLISWLETRNEVGIVEASNQHEGIELDKIGKQVLSVFNIENVTMSMIENAQGEIIGIVGLSNRKHKAFDYRLLNAITRFVAQDVSQAMLKDTLNEIYKTDILTGFYSRLEYSRFVDTVEKNPPNTIGILFVNVNGLKKINVGAGYARGDSHIKKAAEILKKSFDCDFYRISGDEFVGVLSNVQQTEFEQMVNAHHSLLKKQENYIYAIGHTWGAGRADFLKLVNEADTVMYINKQEYYHVTKQYSNGMTNGLLQDLLCSLSQEEFMVYLQPQICLEKGRLVGAEALIRRFDKVNNKMIFPDQFIPLYEKNSIIRHVDIFVVERVCQLLTQWKDAKKQIPISVNLSRVTLLEHGIVETIAAICDKYQVPHHLLVLEVTERVGLIENEVATSLIEQFHDLGFEVSLDDFGCAYSNIVTLAQISVDEVKVDRSLVEHLLNNEKNRIIARSVVEMCQQFHNTRTLAEGIEVQEQADLLKHFGCTYGQGYLYSRPIPEHEFNEKYMG